MVVPVLLLSGRLPHLASSGNCALSLAEPRAPFSFRLLAFRSIIAGCYPLTLVTCPLPLLQLTNGFCRLVLAALANPVLAHTVSSLDSTSLVRPARIARVRFRNSPLLFFWPVVPAFCPHSPLFPGVRTAPARPTEDNCTLQSFTISLFLFSHASPSGSPFFLASSGNHSVPLSPSSLFVQLDVDLSSLVFIVIVVVVVSKIDCSFSILQLFPLYSSQCGTCLYQLDHVLQSYPFAHSS